MTISRLNSNSILDYWLCPVGNPTDLLMLASIPVGVLHKIGREVESMEDTLSTLEGHLEKAS